MFRRRKVPSVKAQMKWANSITDADMKKAMAGFKPSPDEPQQASSGFGEPAEEPQQPPEISFGSDIGGGGGSGGDSGGSGSSDTASVMQAVLAELVGIRALLEREMGSGGQ